MPRPEEVPPAKAKLRETEANYEDWEDQRLRGERLVGRQTIAEEEMTRRRQGAAVAREQMVKARADLELLQAGAWQADKTVSLATVDQMAAQVRQTETDLERLEAEKDIRHALVGATLVTQASLPAELLEKAESGPPPEEIRARVEKNKAGGGRELRDIISDLEKAVPRHG